MGARAIAFWNWLTKSRYVLYLEQEVIRLREREQATTNSLLSGMGLPQIGPRVTKPMAPIQGRMMPSQIRTKLEQFDRKQNVEEDKPNA